MSYDHGAVESRWQAEWKQRGTFATSTDRTRPKYYVLDMFPYPSGSGLHVGHPKGYVATDVVSRARKMMGYNVLRVMGWDSFGLPAERQAVREDKHPSEITARNIGTFKGQLEKLGLSYDWERELATSDEEYYRWTQWIFLQLYKKGLAYQAEVPVNWCPALGTVLANEEVVDGKYIESGDPVERRSMKQWMFKITEYAESLLAGLDDLDWPEGIKTMQREWIGRSEGAQFSFKIADSEDSFQVFTTRPDTLYGCSYVVLAPEHPLVNVVTTAEQAPSVAKYVAVSANRSDRDRTTAAVDAPKTGAFTGAYAVNPVNGERVPVWTSDYVLAHYGTGAVFACPAHDERDHAFANTFDLPIRRVVEGGEDVQDAAYTGDGAHVNSEFLDGLEIDGAKRKIIAWLEENGIGKGTVQYRLRDWLFSRQRYWGEPFPLVFLEDGTVVPVPESELPVRLPNLREYKPTADGKPPLARAEGWVKTTAPGTNTPAIRETNTMPQWAGSCWYYLRFISPRCTTAAWDSAEEKYWMPVDLYVGGAEHAVLHLLYSRFWHHVLHDLGLVSTREPFQRLFNQGMIHANSFREYHYADDDGAVYPPGEVTEGDHPVVTVTGVSVQERPGKYRYPEEVEKRGDGYIVKSSAAPVRTQLEKMSKSRYNVVNPDDMCEQYGADAMRLYELFMGPLDSGAHWETSGVAGTRRFLDRVWRLVVDDRDDSLRTTLKDGPDEADLERELHLAIKKVTESVESLKFNTAISQMMMLVNAATKAKTVSRGFVISLLTILSPFAPHIAEELWSRLGQTDSIATVAWPEVDEAKLVVSTITLIVQINGKMRGKIEVSAEISKDDAIAAAHADASVAKWTEGKTIRREIYVPGRLVNIVVS